MKNSQKSRLTRIGVFYDGNYFYHVSNYYFYSHPRQARISISGLHEFIREKVCEMDFSKFSTFCSEIVEIGERN